jgi:cytosine deaminase
MRVRSVQGFAASTPCSTRREFADVIDIQVVAFPQEGILKTPGAGAMMVEAMKKGADVVGGIPYNDADARKHIDWVFELARDFDKDLDFHQDFRDDADAMSIEYLARMTIAAKYEGRVSVGHLTALGAAAPRRRKEIIALLHAAGISVMCLPATDMHLGGRKDETNVRRTLTPVRALRDGGVNVCLATNNICNAFRQLRQRRLVADRGARAAAPATWGRRSGERAADADEAIRPKRCASNYGLGRQDADLVLLDTQGSPTRSSICRPQLRRQTRPHRRQDGRRVDYAFALTVGNRACSLPSCRAHRPGALAVHSNRFRDPAPLSAQRWSTAIDRQAGHRRGQALPCRTDVRSS